MSMATPAGSNTARGYGGWTLFAIIVIGAGLLYQGEGGKLFGPDGLSGRFWRADAIHQVLRADSRTMAGADSVATVVVRMRRIDLSKCPAEFRTAYLGHIHAWELLAAFERDAIAFDTNFNSGGALFEAFVRGLMQDPFGKAREATAELNRLRASYQKATTEIRETYQRVERSAIAHGAALPKRPEPGYTWESEKQDDMREKWTPGLPHPEHPNIVAADKEKHWLPAPGYKWVNDPPVPGDMRVVRR